MWKNDIKGTKSDWARPPARATYPLHLTYPPHLTSLLCCAMLCYAVLCYATSLTLQWCTLTRHIATTTLTHRLPARSLWLHDMTIIAAHNTPSCMRHTTQSQCYARSAQSRYCDTDQPASSPLHNDSLVATMTASWPHNSSPRWPSTHNVMSGVRCAQATWSSTWPSSWLYAAMPRYFMTTATVSVT